MDPSEPFPHTAFWTFTKPQPGSFDGLVQFLQTKGFAGIACRETGSKGTNDHIHAIIIGGSRTDNYRKKLCALVYPGEQVTLVRAKPGRITCKEALYYYAGHYLLKERSAVDYDYVSPVLPTAVEYRALFETNRDSIASVMKEFAERQPRATHSLFGRLCADLERYNQEPTLKGFAQLVVAMAENGEDYSHFLDKERLLVNCIVRKTQTADQILRGFQRIANNSGIFQPSDQDIQREYEEAVFISTLKCQKPPASVYGKTSQWS